MIELIKEQRKKYPKICEIIRFLIIGGIATIIDMLVMAGIIYITNKDMFPAGFISVFGENHSINGLVVVFATAIGFAVGLVFNYFFSIIYVYDNDNNYAKTKKGFLLFTILSAIGLIIQSLGMFIGYSLLGINEWVVKVVLVFIVLIFNYITRKIFVFNKGMNLETSESKNSNIKTEKNADDHFISEKITKKSIILNILFIISSFALCLIMYNPKFPNHDNYLQYIYAIITCGITATYLFVLNKNILEKIKFKNHEIKSIFSIIYTIGIISALFEHTTWGIKKGSILAFISIFAIFCYSYLLITFAIKFFNSFWNSLNNFNKKIFISIIVVGIAFNTLIFLFTNLFCDPGKGYDFFISFDTGTLLDIKFYENQLGIENDFRHFFMSLCILPFAVIPSMIADIFEIIPTLDGLLLSYAQVAIISYCIITIISLLKIENKTLIILFSILFLSLSGTFYNILTTEKFVFALFYILTTINMTLNKSSWKWIFFIGSLGILSTNIFLLPIVIFADKKPFKVWFSELVVSGIIFICLLFMTGQFNLFLGAGQSWQSLKGFSTVDKSFPISKTFIQTMIFLASTILSPLTNIQANKIKLVSPSTNFMFIIGIILIILNIVSFVLNYKNKYAIICFYWQLFMLFLLIGIGWGAISNEMFIYSALFTWSTISLIYMLIKKICRKDKITIITLIILIIALTVYNSIEFINIINIAKDIYPGLFLRKYIY